MFVVSFVSYLFCILDSAYFVLTGYKIYCRRLGIQDFFFALNSYFRLLDVAVVVLVLC